MKLLKFFRCGCIPAFAAALILFAGCGDPATPEENDGDEGEVTEEPSKPVDYTYPNLFACTITGWYYLWQQNVAYSLNKWEQMDLKNTNPIDQFAAVRHSEDKWSFVTNDFASLQGSMAGVETTYGCEIQLYKYDDTYIVAVVRVVYPDSPAAKAGLKRGDVIDRINNTKISFSNYSKLVGTSFLESSSCTVGLLNGGDISMTSVEMYEDPVLVYKVLEQDSDKIGYLFYNGFTLKSNQKLISVFKDFKAAGIKDLILDLRYNGGGYVITEKLLASMIAPSEAVTGRMLYEQNVYNPDVSELFSEDEKSDYFETEYKYPDGKDTVKVSTADANLNMSRLYVITGSGTASASESIVVALKAYMNVTVIGEQTVGKFCSGSLMSADILDNAFTNPSIGKEYAAATDNWGMYLMISSYANKNGENACRPNGLTPDVKCSDNPNDGFVLGDPSETMLARTLALISKNNGSSASTKSASPVTGLCEESRRIDANLGKYPEGFRIQTLPSLKKF